MYKYLFLISLITACGTDEKKQAPNQTPADNPKQQSSTMSLAVNASDIPECSDSNKNQLIYVLDLKEFQSCNVTWQKIETPAVAAVAKSKYLCAGNLGTSGKKYYYELTDMYDGSAYVFGTIILTDREVNASRYHMKSQTNVKNGTVAVIFESQEWRFQFERETAVINIYAIGGDSYTQPATECTLISN